MKIPRILSWILQLGAAAVLVMAGVAKFAGRPESVRAFQQLHFDPGGRLTIGGLEILAAVLLLIPRGAIWGAVLAWGLMTGALIAHITHLGFTGEAGRIGLMAVVVWLASIFIVVLRRHESSALGRMFAGPRDDHEGEPPDQP